MFMMGLMVAGGTAVDAITANLLPITARHFTDNVALIAFMVALNRIFGFLVQPYAAWKSDRTRSAGGRRRPFFLWGWPATFVSVGLVGALPFIVPEELHRTATAVFILFTANLMMQACLDVCFGCSDPLYGDTFVRGDLGRAAGIRGISFNVVGLVMTGVAIPLADRHEFYPYVGCMFFVGLSWLIAKFIIREQVPDDLPPQERYNPLKPLKELKDPQVARVTIIASCVLVILAVTEMLHALFVTETLGLSKSVLGYSVTVATIIVFVLSYPIGLLVDKVGPRPVLVGGFVFMLLVELLFVLWVHDLFSLSLNFTLYRIAWLFIFVPVTPMIFQDTALERRGSVFATVQMFRAAAAGLLTIVAGMIANSLGTYRACYAVAAVVCVIGLWVALRLPKGVLRQPVSASEGLD